MKKNAIRDLHLSCLQRTILTIAYQNKSVGMQRQPIWGTFVDATRHEVMDAYYGWHTRAECRRWFQMSPHEHETPRGYAAAQVSVTKSFSRLENRGFVAFIPECGVNLNVKGELAAMRCVEAGQLGRRRRLRAG